MISKRSRLSLLQYLGLQNAGTLDPLLKKHGMRAELTDLGFNPPYAEYMATLDQALSQASQDQVLDLLDEVVRTQGDLRSRVSPKYRYDERWLDLEKCLLLDGYRIEDRKLVPVDPTIEGAPPVEDDLGTALKASGLSDVEQVVRLLEQSADHFRRAPPDYNGALTAARVALESVARSIATDRVLKRPAPLDRTKWGEVIRYLRSSEFITPEEEKGLAGVYGFISPSAHTPLATSEEEMAWLGRKLAVEMMYFLITRFRS